MSTSQTILDRAADRPTDGTSGAVDAPGAPGATRRAYRANIALAIIVTCQLMLVLDGTVVNIALPKIQQALHFSTTSLSWVLNAYMLTFGGLLLLGGRAGDILGRRRVFIAGILLFTLASLLGGFATSAGWLVVARAAQGVGAALAAPSALAFIATAFPEGAQRTRALAIYSAVASAGGSLGLLLGGMLTSWASWRTVLFINVPIGVAVVLLAPLYLQEPERRRGQIDVVGALTATAGVALLVYALIRVSSAGWTDHLALSTFAAALVLLALFVLVERRVAQPLMPLRLFADRNRASAYLNMLLFFATMFGVFFFVTQFLQDVRGISPLMAGVAFLPMTLAMFTTVRVVPRLLPRLGAKPIMVTGAALLTAGIAWLTRLSATTGYFPGILGPMLLLGVGVGSSILPLNVVILSRIDAEDSGAASGALQTMQQVGGALGLALLVTVFGAASRAAAGRHVAGASAPALAHGILTQGIAHAFIVSTGFALGALVVSLAGIRSTRTHEQTPAEADRSDAAGAEDHAATKEDETQALCAGCAS